MRSYRLTYLVFAVILVITVNALAAQAQQPQNVQRKKERPDHQQIPLEVQESRRDFPTANYDEGEPVDPVENALRNKQKPYDSFQMVHKNPHPNDAEVSMIIEAPDLPAIPLTESSVVIVGDVEGAAAHLSENKKSIFSEFTVRIKEVLKSPTALSPDSLITIARNGGFVSYPNGQKVLYRFAGERAPRVGGRYVFFLKSTNHDLLILTAYELNESKISALDELPQFREFKSQDAATFLNILRESIKSARVQEQ